MSSNTDQPVISSFFKHNSRSQSVATADRFADDDERTPKRARIDDGKEISNRLSEWKFDPNANRPIENKQFAHEAFKSRLLGNQDGLSHSFQDKSGITEKQQNRPSQVARQAAVSSSSTTRSNGTDDECAPLDGKAPNIKYTPLEKQILQLKSQYPGVLLIIEVGYKLKFYDQDARIASQELNIMCFPERNLVTAMIPVHRLYIHVKKLIAAGYKVGVVRQIETRALKAVSKNANTPFVRKLSALYTAATWVDDVDEESIGSLTSDLADPKTLVSIVENVEGDATVQDKVSLGMVSVEVATGSIIFDQFCDGHARSELETRLAHLSPAELLVPPTLSLATEKILSSWASGTSQSCNTARIERMSSTMDYNQAFTSAIDFYRQPTSEDTTETESADRGEILALVMSLPHLALIALVSIIKHLQDFDLQSMFHLSSNFQSFSNRTTMILSGNTLANLEIFRSSDDSHSEKGSLIWILDRCKTAMGKRLLRKWVSRPLIDMKALKERADAVEELTLGKSLTLHQLPSLLQGVPDLERGLARMTYCRITPTELATILLPLNRITQEFKSEDQAKWNITSLLLTRTIAKLAEAKTAVQTFLNQISIKQARENNKADLFVDPDAYPSIQDAKDNISIVESELAEHLKEVRKVLKRPSLEYTTVAGIPFLIEVRTNDAKKVPADWLRISATKTMVRFHTPDALRLNKKRDQYQETLQAVAQDAFVDFVKRICTDSYLEFRNVILSMATLDVLVSLASVATLPGYCKPELDDGSKQGTKISIKAMRHPIIEALRNDTYVANDIDLGPGEETPRAILLTGSNMGGKSSIVRALALNVILAQIGCYVPAKSAQISLHDCVLTRMGASDDLIKGRSTFMVEIQETSQILKTATSKSLVILDELGRGTSTHDGLAIAYSVLHHFLQKQNNSPNLIFVTHYFQLSSLENQKSNQGNRLLSNKHMAFIESERKTEQGELIQTEIHFLYRLRPGMASKSFGIHCASLAGLPFGLLRVAQDLANQKEKQNESKRQSWKLRGSIELLNILFSKSCDELTIQDLQQAKKVEERFNMS